MKVIQDEFNLIKDIKDITVGELFVFPNYFTSNHKDIYIKIKQGNLVDCNTELTKDHSYYINITNGYLYAHDTIVGLPVVPLPKSYITVKLEI